MAVKHADYIFKKMNCCNLFLSILQYIQSIFQMSSLYFPHSSIMLLYLNLNRLFFGRKDAELVDDSCRNRVQLIKCHLEADGGRHLQLCKERQAHTESDRYETKRERERETRTFIHFLDHYTTGH